MYAFRRPPYLRWIAAACIVAGALWMDLRGEPTELRPFARGPIAAGTLIDESMIDYRRVATGLLPPMGDERFALTSIDAGEPLTPAVLTTRQPLPDGWWALELEVPNGVAPGARLQLVLESAEATVPAIVVDVQPADQAGWDRTTALIAVPADTGPAVVAAASGARLGMLVTSW